MLRKVTVNNKACKCPKRTCLPLTSTVVIKGLMESTVWLRSDEQYRTARQWRNTPALWYKLFSASSAQVPFTWNRFYNQLYMGQPTFFTNNVVSKNASDNFNLKCYYDNCHIVLVYLVLYLTLCKTTFMYLNCSWKTYTGWRNRTCILQKYIKK